MQACKAKPGVRARMSEGGARRRVRVTNLLLQCLTLASLAPPAAAMQGTKRFVRNQQELVLFDEFCFINGSTQISIATVPADTFAASLGVVSMLICDASGYKRLSRNTQFACEMDFEPCKYYRLEDGSRALDIAEDRLEGMHYFVLRTCSASGSFSAKASDALSISIRYLHLNSGDSHLSCENANLPQIYLTWTVVWIITLAVWMAAWWWRRSQASFIHRAMCAVPLMMALHANVTFRLWEHTDRVGESNSWLLFLSFFFGALNISTLMTMLLALGKGMHILSHQTSVLEKRTLIIAMCWVLVGIFSFRLLGGFVMFLVVVVFVIVVRLIFLSIAMNFDHLSLQYDRLGIINRSAATEAERLWCTEMLIVYKYFRASLSWFIVLNLLILTVSAFALSHEHQPMVQALTDLLQWLLVLAVGWIFRARAAPVSEGGGEVVDREGMDGDGGQEMAVGGGARAGGRVGDKPRVVVVVLPGPCGMWALSRGLEGDKGLGGLAAKEGQEAEVAARAREQQQQRESAGDRDACEGAVTYEQLLERVAIGFSLWPPHRWSSHMSQLLGRHNVDAVIRVDGDEESIAVARARDEEQQSETTTTTTTTPPDAEAAAAAHRPVSHDIPDKTLAPACVPLPGETEATADAIDQPASVTSRRVCDEVQHSLSERPLPSKGILLDTVIQPIVSTSHAATRSRSGGAGGGEGEDGGGRRGIHVMFMSSSSQRLPGYAQNRSNPVVAPVQAFVLT